MCGCKIRVSGVGLRRVTFCKRRKISSRRGALKRHFFVSIRVRLSLSNTNGDSGLRSSIGCTRMFSLIRSVTRKVPYGLLRQITKGVGRRVLTHCSGIRRITAAIRGPSMPVRNVLGSISIALRGGE